MFGSTAIEVAIGIFFLYFVLSIVSSAVMEAIAQVLALRSRTMFNAIDSLLDGLNVSTADFFQSPHIAPLALDDFPDGTKAASLGGIVEWVRVKILGGCPGGGKGVPTYIPSERFTTALMTLLQDDKGKLPSPPQFLKLANAVETNVAANKLGSNGNVGTVPRSSASSPAPALHAAHLFIANTQEALGMRASDGAQLLHLRKQFDKWYSETMDRASGWYKRTTQKWIFALACLMVLTLNIDSVALVQRLSHDPATRTMLAQSAAAATQARAYSASFTATSMSAQDELHHELARIDDAAIPFGWQKGEFSNSFSSQLAFFKKFGGLVLTIFAVSLGAPFWFGILTMLVNLRAAGPAPQDPTKSSTSGISPGFTIPSASAGVSSAQPGSANLTDGTSSSPLPDNYWGKAKRKDDWSGFPSSKDIFSLGAKMARCAVLAYENEFFVRSVVMGSWNLPPTDLCTFLNPGGTQAFVMVIHDAIVVAFRGTQPSEFADIIDDACCNAIKRPDLGNGVVSIGFAASLDERLASIDACVRTFLQQGSGDKSSAPKQLFVTGHSLGAALATLYASHAAVVNFGAPAGSAVLEVEVHLCTYGSPRVGDAAFGKALEVALAYSADQWRQKILQRAATPEAMASVTRVLRFIDNNDIVTRVPPDDVFVHAGPDVFLTAAGNADLTMTESERFGKSVIDVVTSFKSLASSSLADHASGKYLAVLESLARQQ